MKDSADFVLSGSASGDQMVLTTYGRSSGFCVDPIEKKPLNHFLPGTSVLSFGTAGCNLGCRFCQNWDISKAREWDKLADAASPEQIGVLPQTRFGKSEARFGEKNSMEFEETQSTIGSNPANISSASLRFLSGTQSQSLKNLSTWRGRSDFCARRRSLPATSILRLR